MKLMRKGKKLYKSVPMYDKQKKIDAYMKHRISRPEWSGRYFADNEEVAKSYGQDYLTDGKGGFYLITMEFKKDVYILSIKNKQFADGSIPQETKAQKLKDFFKDNGLGNIRDKGSIPDYLFTKISEELKRYYHVRSIPLVATLNNLQLALECPHDQSNTEIIFPASYNVNDVLKGTNSKLYVHASGSDPSDVRGFNNINEVTGRYKTALDYQKNKIDRENEDSRDIIVD